MPTTRPRSPISGRASPGRRSSCAAFGPSEIDGSEERDLTITAGSRQLQFKGQQYLLHFALPNFYFHTTTAYAILRHCGVQIGKRDFLGAL